MKTPLVRRLLRLLGLSAVFIWPSSVSANSPPARDALEQRVSLVREALHDASTDTLEGQDGSNHGDRTAQWWPNWPNWGNWPNWPNWGNWFNR